MIGLLKIRICKNVEICLGLNSVAKICQKIVIVILAKSDSQANGVVSHLLANRIILAIKKYSETTQYSKNNKKNKFNKIQDIRHIKTKKALDKSANFANRKSNKTFLVIKKGTVTNISRITRVAIFFRFIVIKFLKHYKILVSFTNFATVCNSYRHCFADVRCLPFDSICK